MNSENIGALGVSDANRYIKSLIDSDALLNAIAVRGEISNLKAHTSGHIYFTLKDEASELAAVMFRSAAGRLAFSPKNGMQVTAYGNISVYERSGKYQLYVSAILDNGKGALAQEYERLKQKLASEGLFDEERKIPLPAFPQTIGIVTSPTGAAVRDMINVTGRRWPSAKLLIYPSLVQGEEAPQSLCQGVELLNAFELCDLIIIGRGGGSIEDLWAFNDERVVRAVANSEIPIISAVGHETDFTLCDFAADMRAPTPSAAAELVVPDKRELKVRIDEIFNKADSSMLGLIDNSRERLEGLKKQLLSLSPAKKSKSERIMLSQRSVILQNAFSARLQRSRDAIKIAAGRLDAMDPLRLLIRGYSIVSDESGEVLNDASMLKEHDIIDVRFAKGSAKAEIISVCNCEAR